jgi:mono/diheme cytochrome c family protein
MTVRVVIGVAIACVLLTAGCGSAPRPTGTPTPGATPFVAASATAALASPVAAIPPQPNPLPAVAPGGNKDYAAVPGADITANGAAATIHGSVAAGQVVFVQNCQQCHGAEGKSGIANPNSTDGAVPVLNPIDPGFNATAKGDPAIFARELDLFIQHGSLPAGPNPTLSMSGWGDQKKLTQQQIADVEAYLMQLNGVTWSGQ